MSDKNTPTDSKTNTLSFRIQSLASEVKSLEEKNLELEIRYSEQQNNLSIKEDSIRKKEEEIQQLNNNLENTNKILAESEKIRKDLENKLTESQQRLEYTLIEYKKIKEEFEIAENKAILELDKKGKITRANQVIEEILGYKSDELKGMYIPEICAEEDKKCISLIETLSNNNFRYEGTNRIMELITKLGKKKKLGTKITIVYDEKKGDYVGSIWSFEELAFYKRWLARRKRDGIYSKLAPQILDEEYKKIELKEITAKSIMGDIRSVSINLEDTIEIKEDVLKTFKNLFLEKQISCEIYFSNASATIKKILMGIGFKEENFYYNF